MDANTKVLQFKKSPLAESGTDNEEPYNRSRALDQLQIELLRRENKVAANERDLADREVAFATRMRDEGCELASLKGEARRELEEAQIAKITYQNRFGALPPPSAPNVQKPSNESFPAARIKIDDIYAQFGKLDVQISAFVHAAAFNAMKCAFSFAFSPAIPAYALCKSYRPFRESGLNKAVGVFFSTCIELTILGAVVPAIGGAVTGYNTNSFTADGVIQTAKTSASLMNTMVHDEILGTGFHLITRNQKMPDAVINYVQTTNGVIENLSATAAALLTFPKALSVSGRLPRQALAPPPVTPAPHLQAGGQISFPELPKRENNPTYMLDFSRQLGTQ